MFVSKKKFQALQKNESELRDLLYEARRAKDNHERELKQKEEELKQKEEELKYFDYKVGETYLIKYYS